VQATLLGLAITAILALVAALVAPLVVDWNAYRPHFEAQASALLGTPVRITGAIDARILPSPLFKLRAVEVGPQTEAPQLRIGAVTVDVALGPLLRGEVRAKEMHLAQPEILVGLNPSGRIEWPRATPGFRADALSITRLSIEQGRAVLTDAGSA
jgi:large subunit ribosomal protein L24